jgi:hypothetical protein
VTSADLRTAILVVILSVALADVTPLPVTDPCNDFVMYYDEASGVDRSPSVYGEYCSVWLYTPASRTFFHLLFMKFPRIEDAHRLWAGLNMLAIIAVLLLVARRGWVETLLVLPFVRDSLDLWSGGNIAPLLTAISLTPLGAIFSCAIKPYFFLFLLLQVGDRLDKRSTWAMLGVAALLASYSVLGLTDDQRSWIIRHRLFADDYWYVVAVLLSLAVTRFKGKARSIPIPSPFRKTGFGSTESPGKL